MVYSSAYRRSYQEPSWDDYSKQEYVSKMQYRSDRRSIEHLHQPWHWESDTEEDDIEEIADEEGEKRGRLPAPREEKIDRRVPKQAWEERREVKENGHAGDKALVLPKKLSYEEKDEDEKPKHSHASRARGATYKLKDHDRQNHATKHHRSPEERTKHRSHPVSPEKNKTSWTGKSKQAPFLPYGWANEGPVDMWRTHNVLAHKPEVYPAALRAQKRRQQEVKKKAQLRDEAVKKKQVPAHFDVELAYPKTWWLTEYQRNFCKEEDVKRHFLR